MFSSVYENFCRQIILNIDTLFMTAQSDNRRGMEQADLALGFFS